MKIMDTESGLFYGISSFILFILTIVSGLGLVIESTSTTGFLMNVAGLLSVIGLKKGFKENKSYNKTIGLILNGIVCLLFILVLIGSFLSGAAA